MMLEGMSIRSVSRITGLHKNTILSLMLTASENAQKVFDARVRSIRPRFVQLKELWTMVGCHGKNLRIDSPADWGDAWTCLALDSDSKMILSYYIGPPNMAGANQFLHDVSQRTLGVYRMSSGALKGCVGAIEEWYGRDVHLARLPLPIPKPDGRSEAGPEWCAGRTVIAAVPKANTGTPGRPHISPSRLGRCNLSVRMHNRRYARKTNAISKKLANLKAAVALWVVWYNFSRVHTSLRVTPAMEAGTTDHMWSLAELVG